MPDFVIRISTPADLSGLQQTGQALGAVQAGVNRLVSEEMAAGRATEDLSGKLNRVREANASFQSVSASVTGAGHSMHALTGETEGFLSKIETGFGVGIGEKVIGGVEEIGHAFTEVLHKGIEYDAEVQTLGISIASSLRAAEPEKFKTFGAAARESAGDLETLRDKAKEAGLSFRPLAESFGITLPILVEAGVTKINDQMDLVVRLTQIAASKGLSGNQAMKDIIDELSGRGERTLFGKELDALGLTPKAIEAAKEQGRFAEEILGKTASYGEAAAASANSYGASLRVVHDELDKLAGDVAKPVFDKLITLLQGGKGLTGSTEATGIAKGIGNTLGGVLDEVQAKLKSTEDFLGSHPMVAKLLGLLPTVVAKGTGLPVDNPNTLAGGLVANIQGSEADADVDAQTKLIKGLQEKIAAAKDDKAVAEARKALEEAIADATERAAKGQGESRDRAKDFLVELRAIQSGFDAHAGNNHADADDAAERAAHDAKKDADAMAKFLASAQGKAFQAGQDGSPGAETEEKHAKAVEKLATALEKAFGFTQARAKALAEQVLTTNEVAKETERTDKALEGIVAKEEKLAGSKDIGAKLKGTYDSLLNSLPAASKVGLNDQPTDANLGGFTKAVQALPVPTGDKAAADSKAALVKILEEAVRLQKEYNAAVEKESTDARGQADAKKQHDDTLRAQQEDIAILKARAAGNDTLADQLEKEMAQRAAIKKLQEDGLSYTEAEAAVREKMGLQAEADARKNQPKNTDPSARQPGESGDSYLQRTGRIDGHATDTDPGGGLHTGTTETGGLDSGTLAAVASLSKTGIKPGDAVKVNNLPDTQKITGTVNVGNFPTHPQSHGAKDVSSPPLPLLPNFKDPSKDLAGPTAAGRALSDPKSANFGDPSAALNVPTFTKIGDTNNGAGGAGSPSSFYPFAPSATAGVLPGLLGDDPVLGPLFGGAPTAADGLGGAFPGLGGPMSGANPAAAPGSGTPSNQDNSAKNELATAYQKLKAKLDDTASKLGTLTQNIPTKPPTPPSNSNNDDLLSRMDDVEQSLDDLDTRVGILEEGLKGWYQNT